MTPTAIAANPERREDAKVIIFILATSNPPIGQGASQHLRAEICEEPLCPRNRSRHVVTVRCQSLRWASRSSVRLLEDVRSRHVLPSAGGFVRGQSAACKRPWPATRSS